MNIHKNIIYILALLLIGTVSCEKPLKDFNLQISTDLIKDYVTLKVVDIQGNSIKDLSIKLLSGDIQDIYNLDGYKDFKPVDNLINFGLDPKRTASASSPIRFSIEIKAPEYLTQTVPVVISGVSAGIQTVVLIKPNNNLEGTESVLENVNLTDKGAIANKTTLKMPSAVGKEDIEITIPEGTQFKDDAGNIIVGNILQLFVTSIDAYNTNAIHLLPGSSLRTNEVFLSGGKKAAGTLSSLAVAEIKMLINGISVTSFSQPLTIRMPVNSNYSSPITGKKIANDMSVQLFSNSKNGIWTFEQNNTISGTLSTGYYVSFPINHLSFYMAAEFGEACVENRLIEFSGDWINEGFTYPITVNTKWGDNIIATAQYSINKDNNKITVDNIPAIGASIEVYSASNHLLAEGLLASCNQLTHMELPNPGNAQNKISTLQLYVRCPDKTDIITLLPTFQMFYRISGSTEFHYLGAVDNGLLRTTLLKTDGTKYDFKAVWNDRVKIVEGHTVKEDNSGTIGTSPNDIIGTKAGATNLKILTEECKKL